MAFARSPSHSSNAFRASSVLLPVWSATSCMSSSARAGFAVVAVRSGAFSVTVPPMTW